ncbi:MAG TPA: hypothetical protein VNE39_28160 [Planctomycetota bacterium]|nr:hypothetical protein [Planctomycetota bacterium]
MSERAQTVGPAPSLPDRKDELRVEIAKLAARVEHMIAEAMRVEKGQTDVKKRFEGEDELRGRDESLKFQPSAAVGYWREVREQEVRLDTLRNELRALEDLGAGDLLRVEIHFDGPREAA